jgi:hypothetical protein
MKMMGLWWLLNKISVYITNIKNNEKYWLKEVIIKSKYFYIKFDFF